MRREERRKEKKRKREEKRRAYQLIKGRTSRVRRKEENLRIRA